MALKRRGNVWERIFQDDGGSELRAAKLDGIMQCLPWDMKQFCLVGSSKPAFTNLLYEQIELI